MDEMGRPLYGDVFGVDLQDVGTAVDEEIDKSLWGELESEEEEEEEEDSLGVRLSRYSYVHVYQNFFKLSSHMIVPQYRWFTNVSILLLEGKNTPTKYNLVHLLKNMKVLKCQTLSAAVHVIVLVLTRNRLLSCDSLMLAIHIVLFLPMQSSLTSF